MKLYSHFSANNILLKEFPFPRELAMEAYLIENEKVLRLSEGEEVQIIDAELPVKSGRTRKNTDGRIDLLALYDDEVFGIIELKKDTLTLDHLEQLKDYFDTRDQIFDKHKDLVKESEITNHEQAQWVGILVGTDIEARLQQQIVEGSIKINDSIPVAAIIIKRYKSEETGQIFVTTDTYFKDTQRNLDRTKYQLNGQPQHLGKGRLVHAIIKQYISEHPTIALNDLEKVFPKLIQGKYHGVFDTLENAEEIYAQKGRKRHFLDHEDVLTVDGIKIVVCSQWGIGNIGNIIKVATERCGYKIKEIQ